MVEQARLGAGTVLYVRVQTLFVLMLCNCTCLLGVHSMQLEEGLLLSRLEHNVQYKLNYYTLQLFYAL